MKDRSNVQMFMSTTLAGLFLCVGCNQQDGSADQVVVGFSQVGAESSWRTAETASIEKEAEKRGAKLQLNLAQQKQANQIRAIRSYVKQRVDVIVLAPVVEAGWEPVLKEVRKAGIPVILVDRGIDVEDDTLYTTLIASDFVEEGRMAAQWLAEELDGKGSIIELKGTTGAAPAVDRERGFAEGIADYPELQIINSQSADFSKSKGKEVMEAIIQAEGENIDAVYAHNDDMALGAILALEEAGMKPGEEVIVISIDGVKGAFEAMVEGKLNATVECNPLFGPILFDTIEKVLAGQDVPKYIKNEDKLYDQSMAAEVIDSREY